MRKAHRLYGFVRVFLIIGMPTALLAQVSHSVSFSRSDLEFTTVIAEDGIEYEKISMRGLRQTDEIAKPSLPVFI